MAECVGSGLNGISSGTVPALASVCSQSPIVASESHAIFLTAGGVFGLCARCTNVATTVLVLVNGTIEAPWKGS